MRGLYRCLRHLCHPELPGSVGSCLPAATSALAYTGGTCTTSSCSCNAVLSCQCRQGTWHHALHTASAAHSTTHSPSLPCRTAGWGPTRSIQGFARIAETEKGMTKFSGYYAGGFYLNNVQVPGSVMVCRDMYLMWKPRRLADVTPDSLVFLELLHPAPQVLVLGCGQEAGSLSPEVQQYLSRLGVSVELLDSRIATGYFNVLNDEGRSVVAALLVMDPGARMPQGLPQPTAPLWDRPSLQTSGRG